MGKKSAVAFSGDGVVTVIPDQAVVNLNVNSKNTTSLEATVAEQAEKKRRVLEFLSKLGVKAKNVSSSGYANGPEVVWEANKQVKTGWYLAQETVTVKVPTALANKVTGGTAKWSEVGGVQFTVSRALTNKAREEAVELAIADAEAKAKRRADRLQFDLGKLVGFVEGSANSPQPYRNHRAYALAAEAAVGNSDTALNEGETEVTANVVLTYLMENK